MPIHHDSTAVVGVEALLSRLERVHPTGSNRWVACCPLHGSGRNQALSIRLEGATVLLHCFGGCSSEAILETIGLSWRELYQGTEKPYTSVERVVRTSTPVPSSQGFIEHLWASGRPVHQGGIVARYLEGRGLHLNSFPTVLRELPSLSYWEGGKSLTGFCGMLARVEHPQHGLVAIHRTYLESDGQQVRKARVPSPKKLTRPLFEGAVMGSAIRLFEPIEKQPLALAEGIETALAVHLATGLPVWACISAAFLEGVLIPSGVPEVLICADNDQSGTGQRAALGLASRLLDEGKRVRVATPPRVGMDWLDELGKVNPLEVAASPLPSSKPAEPRPSSAKAGSWAVDSPWNDEGAWSKPSPWAKEGQ